MKANVIIALATARAREASSQATYTQEMSGKGNVPLPTQKGPVLPLVVFAPPKSVNGFIRIQAYSNREHDTHP